MADERLLGQWLEHWVDHQPEALALTGDDGFTFTYAELDAAVNRIANAIDDTDPVGHLPRVAIAIEQSTAAVLAVVAVARSGRTAVPLDVAAPPARVAATLDQVGPVLVLTTEHDIGALAALPAAGRPLLLVDPTDVAGDGRRRPRPVDLEGLEVIQFTSGSTGVPKGVPRPNRAAVGALLRRQGRPSLGPGRRVALTSDFQWAAGWGTIRDAFCTGSSLHRYSTRRRGPADLARWLDDEAITTWPTIPSLAQAMLDASPGAQLPHLRWLGFSGDILHRSLVERLREALPADATISNRYGASETGGVAAFEITRDTILDSDVVPVGEPLDGVQVEVVDADRDGIGEIVITSFRGALGYLGTDDGAAQRISDAGGGLTTYRTGDQGRLRPDGLLELRGRADHMVKIRGQRADLTEVEVAMRDLPEVRSAAVGLRSEGGVDRLVAWFVPTDAGWSVPELRRALRKRLPGYMVPGAFVALDELPRTTRGKLDRAALPDPAPGRPDLGHAYEPPVGPLEQLVADTFAAVLDLEPIGRHDSFFDLGGDSLLAAELMVRLARELGREAPLSALVAAETPASLAVELDPGAVTAGHMVVLQPEGSRPPLYCIHGGGGEVLAFAALAVRLGAERPFVGVQLRPEDPARTLLSVTRLARRYAGEILEHGGGGPCVLAGHSYGGVVAFEVTRLLRQQGVTVTACAVLDVGVPSRRPILGPPPPRTLAPGEDPLRRWKELAYLVHATTGRRPRPERLLTERMNAAIWGMSRYRPAPVDVPVVVVRAQDSPPGRDLEAWAAFSTAGCTVLDVGGDHNSLLNPPHLHGLADALLGALEPLDPPAV